jgi:DCN1-like protein 1/2
VGSKENDALLKLFENYRGSYNQHRPIFQRIKLIIALDEKTDEADTIGVEGTMQYFEQLGINLESVEFLIPMEIVQAPALGEIGKEGFVTGWRRIGLVVQNPVLFVCF